MKDLVIVDPTTGEREDCGAIVKRRVIGDIPLWLTYDEPNRMWWIVWKDEHVRKAGYGEARRGVCWETFFKMTATDIAKLKPS